MTTGPTDGKVTTPAGGPGGMPLALASNEGLGITLGDKLNVQTTVFRFVPESVPVQVSLAWPEELQW